jgi:lactoylglutathione lyase
MAMSSDAPRGLSTIRTLHTALRVTDLDRSIAFYEAVGYGIVGRVAETPIGELTMLKLPDDEFVTIELVHDPSQEVARAGTSLSHFVIAVECMDTAISELSARGVDAGVPTSPDGSVDFLTTSIVDPDGHRIELVQWPAGHAAGMSVADWPD